ncbi:MAG: AAA family ATPase [Caldilineaceae bacterium]|nr:AAA family ATPase [Caldilineaceae bacterium]MBP8121221.1 AAA family ATPase [Caldilineaceae bacterium]MBP9071950.1 AAA family ATPase [Caldilineaceae bacterium]
MSDILHPQLLQDLLKLHQSMLAEGKLRARAQLEQYYSTFRMRFGPQVLANLDGESLLLTMHDHGTYESLVYWLEFKNDDEMPAIFGSIAGGSALKFGIYKRKETGAWMTGSPQKQLEISVEQAIDVARKHRDQLLQGVKLLEDLPANGSDADYVALQKRMDEVAPDVSRMAWGHKYFSLLFPDKLDDYHVASYGHFHLVKLMQTPPTGEGRFLVGGRYVQIARELDIPMNHLTSMLNERHGNPHRYWRVLVNYRDEGFQNMFDKHLAGGYVAIGWRNLGDLSDLEPTAESKKRFQERMKQTYNEKGGWANEIFNFVTRIEEGDIVLAMEKSTVLGVGRVLGGYAYDTSNPLTPNRRPVEWLTADRWQLDPDEAKGRIVREIRDFASQVATERSLFGAATPVIVTPDPVRKTGPAPRLDGIPGRIQAILERKKQVILYGPPGTGKTYWARYTALELSARTAYDLAYGDLDDAQKMNITGSGNVHGVVSMCTFHPAYGYEDFLEGYRPHTAGEQLHFALKDGIFKKLCQRAAQEPNRRFYLIIDEINRGDIPRIFGELLTVLEKDKRSAGVVLPLSGERFIVPENVYIIGTMNTADRSIALLDTALRRRFGFVEVMPDSAALGAAVLENTLPLGAWLDALNRQIVTHIGRDARNLQIGHAYLLGEGRPITSLTRFVQVLQDDIIPLLQEYCYEDYATLARLLGSGLVDEERQRIRQELFSPARHVDLLQALVEPYPDIQTSPAALASDAAEVENQDDVDGNAIEDEAA